METEKQIAVTTVLDLRKKLYEGDKAFKALSKLQKQIHSPVRGLFDYTPRGMQLFKAPRPFGRLHLGVDYPTQTGDTVYATFSGVVKKVNVNPHTLAGRYTIVEGKIGKQTVGVKNLHLSKVFVQKKQLVKAGFPLGITGNSGVRFVRGVACGYSPHLHHSMYLLSGSGKRTYIDPQIIYEDYRKLLEFIKVRDERYFSSKSL